ncbi:Iron-sulfur assembly protein [Taphrina deformans PYCC 5710]|uniref:Iron-sulfur assembly protein n=1 Tax=Taphrina deformans (strain PYCC 5710 / ATCC 11124 / CBS 356.35 / IMI 108563 / JCM 9778 / NBRC 8474) TaxID=1097556 RepID=R4X8V4_TAPDE|nr:Iron-sulfur assembly protein [Taphrina deformans PYCC 5710]|eukprot:CCG82079.1 Iron-sulfur assembly protein [Taphrina deformans PYCC 5710]
MLLFRSKHIASRCLQRQLTTATAYQPHTIPTHPSPPREAYPKIPNFPTSTPASTASPSTSHTQVESPPTIDIRLPENATQAQPAKSTNSGFQSATPKKVRRPRKQVLTLTTEALCRLREIQSEEGKMIKISVVAKGCAGGAYKLEYVEKAERFDEVVQQEDVKVLVDSKSLLKIIGSIMDFQDDVLSSRFTFRNPNVVSTCGCEESVAFKPTTEAEAELQ